MVGLRERVTRLDRGYVDEVVVGQLELDGEGILEYLSMGFLN